MSVMRIRSAAMFLAGALAATSLISGPVRARPVTPRSETKEYLSPALALMPVHPYGAAVCNQGGVVEGNKGCVDFTIQSFKERFIEITVEDATGLPVPAFLAWNDDPSTWIPFCGSTNKPLRSGAGTATVWLYPYRSPNLPTCAGTATTGSVTMTFLRSK